MHRNSAANKAPASKPGSKCASRKEKRMPRTAIMPMTSRAASAERMPNCETELIAGAASLIATCCKPHSRHRKSMRKMAKPSRFLRVGIMRPSQGRQETSPKEILNKRGIYPKTLASFVCRRNLRLSCRKFVAARRYAMKSSKIFPMA